MASVGPVAEPPDVDPQVETRMGKLEQEADRLREIAENMSKRLEAVESVEESQGDLQQRGLADKAKLLEGRVNKLEQILEAVTAIATGEVPLWLGPSFALLKVRTSTASSSSCCFSGLRPFSSRYVSMTTDTLKVCYSSVRAAPTSEDEADSIEYNVKLPQAEVKFGKGQCVTLRHAKLLLELSFASTQEAKKFTTLALKGCAGVASEVTAAGTGEATPPTVASPPRQGSQTGSLGEPLLRTPDTRSAKARRVPVPKKDHDGELRELLEQAEEMANRLTKSLAPMNGR
mmetsp:Transcript_33298/g.75896  ORF Transcript_33298/g.75896 Transcript_33298/m.75896 type:complete len:288 (-) Transcript_33298:88-951(-)